MLTGMDPGSMVKQRLCEVQGLFARFAVYATGIPSVLLFRVLDKHGCETGLETQLHRRDLKPEVSQRIPRP